KKAEYGDTAATLWQSGAILVPYATAQEQKVPDHPARNSIVKLVAPQQMPKLGKAGSLLSRKALLHSLVNIESWAIDLSWDIIARFGEEERLPREFFDDFVQVAQDEGRHFRLLAARLAELGSFYGEFPAHEGLWSSAIETSGDLAARLAVEHCVHEARGLDVLPTTISRFRKNGDEETAKLLESVIYPEEITHCAAGVKWFAFLCERRAQGREGEVDKAAIVKEFHTTVRKHFRGPLKPPFNEAARKEAGFGPEWYLPLAKSDKAQA
ncbi:hypothetical protein SELMODRAFT_96792, partial [Selaginella moellendorffii]